MEGNGQNQKRENMGKIPTLRDTSPLPPLRKYSILFLPRPLSIFSMIAQQFVSIALHFGYWFHNFDVFAILESETKEHECK